MEELKHSAITGQVIKSFYSVYNELGYGFLERVYENSLAFELRACGLAVVQQSPIAVYYKGVQVGEYFADLLVNDCVIVEVKAAEKLTAAHEAQLLNYLRATNIEVGLLLNFGQKPDHKRKIFTNDRNSSLSEFLLN